MFNVFSIRYRKLSIVLVPVGEREGDNVIPCLENVKLYAVGRWGRKVIHVGTIRRGYFYSHLAKVFCEGHKKNMTI